jgi:hypothetical protein
MWTSADWRRCSAMEICYHVPRNDALARVEPSNHDAEAHWRRYVADWTRWNHAECLHEAISRRVIRQVPIRSGSTIQRASEVPACAHWVGLMTSTVIWPRARA